MKPDRSACFGNAFTTRSTDNSSIGLVFYLTKSASLPKYAFYVRLTMCVFISTEKAGGMFATIIVILPSPFTGGAVHLSHGGLSTVMDFSAESLLSTSVMAWYTDVTHEVKPITSGYRLALSYNLIHTTTTLRPSLPSTHSAALQLKNIFLSWRNEGYDGLQKIIYLLDHRYSKANLNGSALKGMDSHQIALLNAIAEECGFRIGLASIESHVKGKAYDDDGPERKENPTRHLNCYGYPYCEHTGDSDEDSDDWYSEVSKDDRDPHGFEMQEDDQEAEMSITDLVDLEGTRITGWLRCHEEDGETIPEDLQTQVENGPVDEAEYQGFQGNVSVAVPMYKYCLILWLRKLEP